MSNANTNAKSDLTTPSSSTSFSADSSNPSSHVSAGEKPGPALALAEVITCLFKQAYPNANDELLSKVPVMVQKLELDFSADSAKPSSQTNLEKDGTTEQSIKANDTSNEPKARDSSQATEKKRSASPAYDSTAAVNQQYESERPSKLTKLDAARDVSAGKKPATVVLVSPEFQRQEISKQRTVVLEGPIQSQVNSFLASLPHDALVRSLGFLDVVSVVHCEMTSKFVKNAADKAWIAVDKAIDIDKKANGDTPRERVIRSSPIYRHLLLSKHAAKIEKLQPTSSETLLLDRQNTQGSETLLFDCQSTLASLGDNYDFYIRFARVVGEEEDYGENRRKETEFLSGGVVSPSSSLNNGETHVLNFDLTSLDLEHWPSLDLMLHPRTGTFSEQCAALHVTENGECDLWNKVEETLEDVAISIVAIHRKTLNLSTVLAPDTIDDDLFIHSYQDGVLTTHPEAGMILDEWKNGHNGWGGFMHDCTDYRVLKCKYIFEGDKWTISISSECV